MELAIGCARASATRMMSVANELQRRLVGLNATDAAHLKDFVSYEPLPVDTWK
jgi:hypothetical protein